MSDYTPQEVHQAIVECDDFYWRLDEHYNNPTLTLRGEEVEVEPIQLDLGGEGHGEDIHVVFRVGDQLFRQDGYYASHYGPDWDSAPYEVGPVARTVTFYERKS